MPSAHLVVTFLVGFVCLVVGVVLIPTFNEILPKIRGFLYKRGYRPKYGTILFSPSLDLQYTYLDVIKNVEFPVILQPTTMIGLRNAPATTYIAPSAAIRLSPYELARYCVMCSAELELTDDVAKQCPDGCGYIYLDHNNEGLPVITFTPDDER